jgi:hypothetical protein
MASPGADLRSLKSRQLRRRLRKLDTEIAQFLPAAYKAEPGPDGTVILVPQDAYGQEQQTRKRARQVEAEGCKHFWRCRSMKLSKTNAEILLTERPGISRQEQRALGKSLVPQACEARPVNTLGQPVEVIGGFVPLKARLQHLNQARPFPRSPAGTPGRRIWLNVAMDGTLRWSKSYMHCTVAPTFSKSQDLSSWWLAKGSEKWAALRAMAGEMEADQQLELAAGEVYQSEDKFMEQILFFLLADGKGQVAMAGCSGFNAKDEGGCVCHACCGSRPEIDARFGGWDAVANMAFAAGLPLTAVMQYIPPEQRIPDYGLHGVGRVLLCALAGMPTLLQEGQIAAGRPKLSKAECRRRLQEVLDDARIASKTRSQGDIDAERQAKRKGLRIEVTAALHLMQEDRWRALLVGMNNPKLETWFTGFAKTCKYARQTAPFTPGDLEDMLGALRGMGGVHTDLGFKVVYWAHMWIDHMYAYAYKWKILSVFSCFRMEGSHKELKGHLKNSGGVTGAPIMGGNGINGLQGVLNGNTLDISLAARGYNVTGKGYRSWRKQPAFHEVGGYWQELRAAQAKKRK